MAMEIPLTQGKVALVDDEDYAELVQYKWFAHNTYKNLWYAERNQKYMNGGRSTTQIKMHRVVMGVNGKLDTSNHIDHIDGDGLNNQKSNLRFVTMRQNQQNRHLPLRSSNMTGVTWSEPHKKWTTRVHIGGRTRYLGLFENEIDASCTYRVACKVLFDCEVV